MSFGVSLSVLMSSGVSLSVLMSLMFLCQF